MLYGLALGDALGATVEFSGQSRREPTGTFLSLSEMVAAARIPKEAAAALRPAKWGPFHGHGTYYGEVGQVTDDTEMTIALARAIVEGGGWEESVVLDRYVRWANSGVKTIGRNTRALLGGIKPGDPNRAARTYEKRWLRAAARDLGEYSQSNGCLMRASPLAVLKSSRPALEACALTNPHPTCLVACWFYHMWLRRVLSGLQPRLASRRSLRKLKEAPIPLSRRLRERLAAAEGWRKAKAEAAPPLEVGAGHSFPHRCEGAAGRGD